jgi:hypothetical protein
MGSAFLPTSTTTFKPFPEGLGAAKAINGYAGKEFHKFQYNMRIRKILFIALVGRNPYDHNPYILLEDLRTQFFYHSRNLKYKHMEFLI